MSHNNNTWHGDTFDLFRPSSPIQSNVVTWHFDCNQICSLKIKPKYKNILQKFEKRDTLTTPPLLYVSRNKLLFSHCFLPNLQLQKTHLFWFWKTNYIAQKFIIFTLKGKYNKYNKFGTILWPEKQNRN